MSGCGSDSSPQLLNLGVADVALYDEPELTLWRTEFDAITIFALETHEMCVSSGSGQAGAKSKVIIDKILELLFFTYARIVVPGIGLCDSEGENFLGVNDKDNDTGLSLMPHYTEDYGTAFLKSVCLNIGTWAIDEKTSEAMHAFEQLNGCCGKTTQEMTGNYQAVTSLQLVSAQPHVLHVPIPFSYTQSTGYALPLVSMQFHSLSLSVEARDIQHLVKLTCAAHEAGYTTNDIYLRPKVTCTKYTLQDQACGTNPCKLENSHMTFTILTTQVALGEDEREQFRTGNFEQLIKQSQYVTQEVSAACPVLGTEAVGADQKVSIDLSCLSFPTTSLMWWVHPSAHTNASANSSTCTTRYNSWFAHHGQTHCLTGLVEDPVRSAKLIVGSKARFEKREGVYFRTVQNWQHSTRLPTKYLYTYSFAMSHASLQPSGTMNMSRQDCVKLELELNGSLFWGPSEDDGDDNNTSVTVTVMSDAFNALKFKQGLVAVKYS